MKIKREFKKDKKINKNKLKVENTNFSNIRFLKNISLKKQLLITSIIMVIIPVVTITLFSSISTKKTLSNKIEELNDEITNQMSYNISSFIKGLEETAYVTAMEPELSSFTISTNLSDMLGTVEYDKVNRIKSILSNTRLTKNLNDLFVVYSMGETIGSITGKEFIGADKKELYKELNEIIDNGKALISGYKDEYNNLYFIQKINKDSILIMSIDISRLDNIINLNRTDEKSIVKILNKDNNIIYSTGGDDIGETISEDIINKSQEDSENFEFEKQIGSVSELEFGYKLINLVSKNYIYGDINKTTILIVIIAIISLLIAIILCLFTSNRIVKPILYLVSLMQKVEEGDFTVEAMCEGNNEIGVLTNSFNIMTENIRSLITNVINAANIIDDNVNSVRIISNDSTMAANQVSEAISEIAVGSTEQAKQSIEANKVINNLATSINEVSASMVNVTESSDSTKNIGIKSLNTIKALEIKTDETNITFNKIMEMIYELIDNTKEIAGFIEIINGISNQTNLLALNASIEAARAGDLGKGFAVVAGEVKNLSDQSRQSTEDISRIIKAIRHKTDNVSKLINNSIEVFDEQRQAVEYTTDSFKDILEGTEFIIKEINGVNKLVESMNAIKDKSTKAINLIAMVAEDASASTEEVMASTEEQTALSNNLNNLTIDLMDSANNLRNTILKFKIN